MKKLHLLQTSLFLLFALIVGSTSVWAAVGDPDWSYTVQNGDGSGSGSKLNTTAKTFTVDASHVWSYADSEAGAGSPAVTVGSSNSTYALKFGSSKSVYFNPVILTTDAFEDYAITKVRLYLKHNGSKVGSLTVKQGSVTIGTATTSNTSDWINVTCSETKEGEGGTLEIKYEVDQALYINKIEVWYKELSGTKHTLSSAVSPSATGTVTLGSTSILEGKTTTILAEPADGYYFVNWTYTGTGASITNVNAASTTFTMGTSDATVTANFAEINYWAVTYDYNDGVTDNEEVHVLKAEAASYSLKAAPSRDNYNFTGWKIGETTYAAGAAYTPTGDVTVQAQWEFDGTLITYNKSNKSDLATGAKYVMGASYTSSGTTTWKYCLAMGSDTYLHADVVGEHGSLDASEAVFFNETPEIITLNETADGWTMTIESGKKIGLKGDKQLGYDTGDQTWDLGGTDAIPTFSAQYTNKGTLTTYIMKFNWNSGSSRFNAYTSGQQDVYFYRLDNGKDVYTLTLDFNDGATDDETHRILEDANYSLTTPTRSGYAFTGWNTEENGSGTSYPAGAYVMPADDTILYAQWSTTISKSVSSAGYATYVTPYAVEFAEGDAYVVTAASTSTTLSEVTSVPANTPVLLKGEGTKTATVLASASAPASNLLKVSDGTVVGDDTNIYVLANKTQGVGFYLWDSTAAAIPSGKVYLDLTGSGAKGVQFISFEETEEPSGEATAIAGIETLKNAGVIYNLAGQRVGKDYKGIVIVNGKKMLNK